MAIISRGNLHQLKRHHTRRHCIKGEICEKSSKSDDIVQVDHLSVPSKIRRMAMGSTTKTPKNSAHSEKDIQTSNEEVLQVLERPHHTDLILSDTLQSNIANIDLDEHVSQASDVNMEIISDIAPSTIETSTATPSMASNVQTAASSSRHPYLHVTEQEMSRTVCTETTPGCLLQTGISTFFQTPNKDVQTRMLEEIAKLSRKVDKIAISQKTPVMCEPPFPAVTTSGVLDSEMSRSYSNNQK